ncbi:hypothetical protein BFJ72_g5483 [Fusarium proliferatum]|uniref:Uncharacterized protein n=1 Tax=Gibberella intermedia TaxID=948311 RepID=A0A420TJ65_GIBIN|nr:hypothetical protein BFJ72_g5483 [Fusarium proliferatum]
MSDENFHVEDLDFSCQILLQNLSDQALMLEDSHIDFGEWPLRQPTNIIEGGREGVVYLQGRLLGESKGRVSYEVQLNDKLENFILEFHCPSRPFSKNYLHVISCSSGISVDVRGFNERGSPLKGSVDVRANPAPVQTEHLVVRSSSDIDQRSLETNSHEGSIRVKYDFGLKVPLPTDNWDRRPIHESIAIAAFIRSRIPFPKGTFYNNINDKQWEFFRGIIWNDDPSCLLFVNDTHDNRHFGVGYDWAKAYLGSTNDRRNMTVRSHRGDLQFLHAMGRFDGDPAEDTRTRILQWMKVMYKFACGNQGVSANDPLKKHFPTDYFDSRSTPTQDSSLRDLLIASTPRYAHINVQARALGSCLHIISDSFSLGYTQRRLRNHKDLIDRDSEGYIRFRPGVYGDWGPILCFHNYDKQNIWRHHHYDTRRNSEDPIPKYIQTFDEIVGARNAIEASMKLINLFADKVSWEPDVCGFLKDEVFKLDEKVQPSNHFVDEEVISHVYEEGFRNVDYDYEAGMQRKLHSLDRASRRRSIWWGLSSRWLLVAFGIFATLSLLFVYSITSK